MIVYIHKNPKTKEIFYVGIGVKEERANRFGGSKRNQFWNKYVKKHGEPIVEIVARFETRQQAAELEMELIKKYGRRIDGSGQLVNITIGGDGGSLGVKQSKELVYKRTKNLKGMKHSEKSKTNMRNAQNRPEVKAKHDAIKKDPIWLEKQRAAKLGRKLTKEHKSKISKCLKGKIISSECKLKISKANKGKVRTAEQRERISKAHIGKKRKPESILKGAIANYKPMLNTLTGIYYDSLKDAAASIPMNLNTFRSKMSGHIKNNTPFIYA
jgi:predicted GIY-YIG superfamily endonuclease